MDLQKNYDKVNELLNKTNEEVENLDYQISKLQKQKQEKLDAVNYLRGQLKAIINISDQLASYYKAQDEEKEKNNSEDNTDNK